METANSRYKLRPIPSTSKPGPMLAEEAGTLTRKFLGMTKSLLCIGLMGLYVLLWQDQDLQLLTTPAVEHGAVDLVKLILLLLSHWLRARGLKNILIFDFWFSSGSRDAFLHFNLCCDTQLSNWDWRHRESYNWNGGWQATKNCAAHCATHAPPTAHRVLARRTAWNRLNTLITCIPGPDMESQHCYTLAHLNTTDTRVVLRRRAPEDSGRHTTRRSGTQAAD